MLTASRLPFCGRRDYMSNELFTCLTPFSQIEHPGFGLAHQKGTKETKKEPRVGSIDGRTSVVCRSTQVPFIHAARRTGNRVGCHYIAFGPQRLELR